MTQIQDNIREILAELPVGVRLVAVSKFHPAEAVAEAYAAGQRVFGESRVQELCQKAETLPKDIEWHFIGHLQTNKVRFIAPFVSLIESVDSERIITEINRQAERCGRVIDVLLEIHLAQEETKSGFSPEECMELLRSGAKEKYPNVRFCGIMTMASNTDDKAQIIEEFSEARDFFESIRRDHFTTDDYFAIRSWGMSGDYNEAILTGATQIRIGTRLFGERY